VSIKISNQKRGHKKHERNRPNRRAAAKKGQHEFANDRLDQKQQKRA
jgi:hypothetical protein